MQVILTEEEYNKLKTGLDSQTTKLKHQIVRLQTEYQDLEKRYTQLLVFGVSSSNERLKGKL